MTSMAFDKVDNASIKKKLNQSRSKLIDDLYNSGEYRTAELLLKRYQLLIICDFCFLFQKYDVYVK